MNETLFLIWAILIKHCGATAENFADFQAVAINYDFNSGGLEYRFQGNLGFGGKIWLTKTRSFAENLRVDCYTEDKTPERRNAIDAANHELRQIEFEAPN